MPLNPDGPLKVVSIIITKDQDRRIRALAESQSTVNRRVKLSDIYRDVVDAGLSSYTQRRNIEIATSDGDLSATAEALVS